MICDRPSASVRAARPRAAFRSPGTDGALRPAARESAPLSLALALSIVALLASILAGAAGPTTGAAAAPAAPADTLHPDTADTLPADPVGDGFSFPAADTGVVLDFVSVDSTLLAGAGLLLAFEDTIPFAEGTLDTILVGAPRMKVSEVVRRIGERMARDRARLREHSYTGVSKLVARHPQKEDEPRRWETYESVSRFRLGRDHAYQEAVVWQRERKYEGDELIEEKVDEDVETDWGQVGDAVNEAVPFSLESNDAYRYEILDRRLVGSHVVYKLRFEPRSSFQALPSGTVWVDFSDFVIRRTEGEMTGAVPLPMFLRSIPAFKARRVQKGEHWVWGDIYAKVLLRDIPLLPIPTEVEFWYRTSRHVIDGVAYPDGDDGEGGRP